MPHEPHWNADAGTWEWRITCEYCLEPVYSRGPESNGVTAATLALTKHGVVPFCSPACRRVWSGVSAVETRLVADDIGPDALFGLLPDGANGRVEWPV